ncbi:YwaF family protein [Mesomycoplasma conjunctivae]|uniref:YwaF family protein n=1 Tax=Mesomycoplasma conjunctivae TaxID=45361 RepID=UPI003DA2F5EB
MSYFHWRGNFLTYPQFKFVFYIFLVLGILLLILIYLFREDLKIWYSKQLSNKNNKSTFKNIKTWFIIIGLFLWVFSYISRVIILEIDDYPFKWEFLPFHLCRLAILATGLILIFDKTHFSKYFVVPSTLGALLALAIPDLEGGARDDIIYNGLNPNAVNNSKKYGINWGYDSHLFWEFLITHFLSLVLPFFLQIIQPKEEKITIKVLWKSIYLTFSVALFLFLFSWIIYAIVEKYGSPAQQISWNANWFYMGHKGISTLGELTKWPYNIISLTIIFFVLFWLVFVIKIYFEIYSFNLSYQNRKIRFFYIKRLKQTVFKENVIKSKH